MLQIPNHQLFNKNKSYTALAQLYLHENIQPAIITIPLQQAVLQQLNALIKKEQFYFITDVRSGAISFCNGISTWLGYTDAHFTQKNYVAAIHPAHAVVQGFYALAFFEALINNQITAQFLYPCSVTTLALKHKTGKYFYCKRQCYPFQLTSDNKVTAYLSEFTIIKELSNEDYHSRMFYEHESASGNNDLVKKLAQKKFEETKGFSIQELRILKRYDSKTKVTSEMIAKAFKIEKGTVDTYNKRILKKAENIFGLRFGDARNAAAYLKRVGLL
ncbi:hypothetical protein [Ferruginibacter sp. SUN106]|uniref:hypothetical protein n=1 Tax=Ferruginibacter sp. SUN106 TaxID=2978348 RepID=UPI003D3681ED